MTNQTPETNHHTKQFIRLNKYDYCEIWYIVSFVWFDFVDLIQFDARNSGCFFLSILSFIYCVFIIFGLQIFGIFHEN